MPAGDFSIQGFEPIRMWVENIGPFRDPFELDFTDGNGDPCNMFLLISENGQGKTTLLDVMVSLMRMLEDENSSSFGHEDLDRVEVLGKDPSRAQLDILVRFYQDQEQQSAVLSLIAGPKDTTSIRAWTDSELKSAGASSWNRFGYRRHSSGRMEKIGGNDAFIQDLLGTIRNQMSVPPDGFGDSGVTEPTLLYFSAYRDIPKVEEYDRSIAAPEDWRYRPVKPFPSRTEWIHSLDNLLVWLKWIDEERFQRAIEDVNQWVFRDTHKRLEGVEKDPPQAIISNKGVQTPIGSVEQRRKKPGPNDAPHRSTYDPKYLDCH